MAIMDQPRIQTVLLPGQNEPDDLTLEQPKSSETQGTKPEGQEEGKQEGELYAPVSTKFVNKKQSNNKPSAELDGPPEGAEMNDLYSPKSAVDIETSHKPKEEKSASGAGDSKNVNETDEHERRNEPSGTVISGPGMVEATKGMAGEVSDTLVQLRGRVVEKLSALQVPSETLEAVRRSFETGLKGAFTTTLDAVQRTKQSLLDILPSPLPSAPGDEARKVVEDMEQEVLRNSEGGGEDRSQITKVSTERKQANLAVLSTSAVISPNLQSKL